MRISQTLKLLGLALLILGLGFVGAVGPGLASATQAQPNVEDFETGDFSKFPWQTGGDAPWFITSSEPHQGTYAAKPSTIGDSEKSWLQVTLNIATSGEISFWYRVSSESDHDFLHFSIDDEERGKWSGDTNWQQASFPVPSGSHTFRWKYAKDGSGSSGEDTAYLDDIAFPSAAVFAPPVQPPAGMVLIPAGSFQMGDSFDEGYSDERPVHTVFVSAFYMDKYEVIKALWDEVANWAEDHDYDIKPEDGSGKAADHPVHYVTWYESVKWCNARSEKEGLTPAYYTSSEKSTATVYRSGEVDVQNDWVRWDTGYRLPTEAEWEYAARGGCAGHRFPWCDTDTIQHSRANYYSESDYSYDTSPTRGYHPDYDNDPMPYTSPVGSFAPNGYGLYDMAGNVWEWVWDWYDSDYYSSSPGSDPRGSSSGSSRVQRGGGWNNYADYCRGANRPYYWPDFSDCSFGFRAVLPPGQ